MQTIDFALNQSRECFSDKNIWYRKWIFQNFEVDFFILIISVNGWHDRFWSRTTEKLSYPAIKIIGLPHNYSSVNQLSLVRFMIITGYLIEKVVFGCYIKWQNHVIWQHQNNGENIILKIDLWDVLCMELTVSKALHQLLIDGRFMKIEKLFLSSTSTRHWENLSAA